VSKENKSLFGTWLADLQLKPTSVHENWKQIFWLGIYWKAKTKQESNKNQSIFFCI